MKTALDQIEDLKWYITDPRMDGFSCWGKKKQLYQIMWEAQKALAASPNFVGEEEWVQEHKPT
jgi:hypothetical protein